MFRRDHWQDILADIDSNTPVALKNNLEQAIAIASLNALGSFHMRILYPLLTYPFPILMLAKKSHDEVCPERQQTAARILATPIDHLEASTMKFRIMHFNELQDCARAGLLTKPLHAKVQVIAEQLSAESMTIEGLNNVLKGDLRRAPHTSVQLTNTRLAVKHDLGLVGAVGNSCRKYSVLQQRRLNRSIGCVIEELFHTFPNA